MPELPDIFTFAGCPVLGDLGEDTQIDYVNACERCGREDQVVRFLHFRLDAWHGEAIINSGANYAVTPQLQAALSAGGVRGCSFREMKVTKSRLFDDMAGPDAALPSLVELVIESRLDPAAQSPSGWWDRRGSCPVCGRPFWHLTPRVDAGLLAALRGEIGPPREVAVRGWDGADIFYHEDSGPPLATDRFVAILTDFGAKGVAFHPARWV